jgi:glycerol-3-phosphate dehydrogenase (NAD(P)+)
MTLDAALAVTPGTAEGVKTATSVRDLACREGVDMPITAAVAAVLSDGQPIDLMGQLLLARPHKADGV